MMYDLYGGGWEDKIGYNFFLKFYFLEIGNEIYFNVVSF